VIAFVGRQCSDERLPRIVSCQLLSQQHSSSSRDEEQ